MVLYLRFVDRDQSPVFGDNTFTRVVLASRASLGFLGMLFSFLAIEILPIGDATTIIMLSPLLASFLGIFVLGESWHGMEILGTLVSLAGVAFVSHPMCIWGGINSKCADAYGLIYALLAALFSALAFLAVRLLGTSAKLNWIYVAFAQSLGICLLAISSSLIFGESIELEFDLLVDASILCAGLIGSCGQLMMT
jgi:drug/metabolite transporter (DMT)-like permease